MVCYLFSKLLTVVKPFFFIIKKMFPIQRHGKNGLMAAHGILQIYAILSNVRSIRKI